MVTDAPYGEYNGYKKDGVTKGERCLEGIEGSGR